MRSTLGVPCGRCFHIFGFSIVFMTAFSISDRIHDPFLSLRGSLRGPRGPLGGPWGFLRIPEAFLGRAWGSLGRPRGSLDVSRGLLGDSRGCRNHRKTSCFIVFSAMGQARAIVFSCFRFSIVFTTVFLISDRFFRFSDRFHDRFSVFDRFFRFFSFFSGDVFSTSVFTGAIRFHAARSSAETSGNQREPAGTSVNQRHLGSRQSSSVI